MNVSLCRTCLSKTAEIKSIRNTAYQEVYEKLSNTKLIAEDGRPDTVCHSCYSQLQKCHNFSIMSQKADSMLTQLYHDGIQISPVAIAALHSILDSFGSIKTSPDNITQYNHPVEEYMIQVDVSVKQEPDPVKVELVEIEERYVIEDIKIEDAHRDDKTIPLSMEAPLPVKKEKPEKNKSCRNTRTFKDRNRPYTCDMCDKSFAYKKNLKSHIKIHIKSNACDTCSKKFPNLYELKRHIRSHTGEKPYKCDQCHRTYADSGNLKKHKMTHTGHKSYICTECNASFTLQGNLRRHDKKYHSGDRPVVKLYACDKCEKKFRHELQLTKHQITHTGTKPYTCVHCEKTFAHESYLKAHVKTHSKEKLSACDRCGKTFLDKYRLKRHMTSHTGAKPYACNQCNKTYTDRGNLKKHLMDHSGLKSYICTECNASFTRKGSLQRHLRCHTGEKPYSCDICHKSMSTSTHLKRHVRIHTGERPYVCEVCGKAYSDKDDCKRHMNIHSGVKPFVCSVCDYESFYKKALKSHLASKHPPISLCQ